MAKVTRKEIKQYRENLDFLNNQWHEVGNKRNAFYQAHMNAYKNGLLKSVPASKCVSLKDMSPEKQKEMIALYSV